MSKISRKVFRQVLTIFLIIAIIACLSTAAFAASSPWPERFSMFAQISSANGGNYPGYVKAAQRFLMCFNSNTYSLVMNNGGTDGMFGNATYNAVIDYQQKRGLAVDGVIGANSWKMMGTLLLERRAGIQDEIRDFVSPSSFYLQGENVIRAFIYDSAHGIDFHSYRDNGFLIESAFHHFG